MGGMTPELLTRIKSQRVKRTVFGTHIQPGFNVLGMHKRNVVELLATPDKLYFGERFPRIEKLRLVETPEQGSIRLKENKFVGCTHISKKSRPGGQRHVSRTKRKWIGWCKKMKAIGEGIGAVE